MSLCHQNLGILSNNIVLISAALTKNLTNYPTDEAYMLGLFHNVGHVLMMSKYEGYGFFLEENFNPEDGALVDMEIEYFGMSELDYKDLAEKLISG